MKTKFQKPNITPYNRSSNLDKEKQSTINENIYCINVLFEHNDLEMIKICLSHLKFKKLLLHYFSATNYKIVNWAFEHESQIILNELFRSPEKRHQFLIVSRNDYQYIKEFINRTLQLSFEQFQQQTSSKHYMLTLFLQTKTHLTRPVIEEMMNANAQNKQGDKQTFEALQAMVNEIIATFGDTTEAENVMQQNSQVVPTLQL